MSSRRTLILIAAIAVGVFAGIALLNYVRGIEDDVYADAQPVEVLIASEDIPEGTPAAEAIQLMQETTIPLEIRPATFVPIDGADAIAGLVAQNTIPKNQIIVSGLFVDPTIIQASFTDNIPTGNVAVTLSVDQTAAVGGYLQPGDEVNLMVKHIGFGCGIEPEEEEGTDGEEEEPVANTLEEEPVEEYCSYANPTRYIFQRLEILAIGARQALQAGETSESTIITPQGGAITFSVPNEAAQILTSLDSEMVYLTLLPEDYEAETLRALTFDMMEGPTPAEIPECLTPWGPSGFIAGDSADTVADGGTALGEHYTCDQLWEE